MATHCATTLTTTAPLSVPKEGRVFARMAHNVLGASYELSLVFIGNALSKKLNSTYRNKNKDTNVLAFSLSKTSGEIYINIPLARAEAKQFESTPLSHIRFLFVHGLLHLKGHDHGEKMERLERRLMREYFSKA
ncbi:MAG: rRNA maturation RNase YbeY [Candidatus Campbellbacteria bacterium]|nr:rRNA maturation RNase YbeY [Candidatus Campbellbacteria bacterium]